MHVELVKPILGWAQVCRKDAEGGMTDCFIELGKKWEYPFINFMGWSLGIWGKDIPGLWCKDSWATDCGKLCSRQWGETGPGWVGWHHDSIAPRYKWSQCMHSGEQAAEEMGTRQPCWQCRSSGRFFLKGNQGTLYWRSHMTTWAKISFAEGGRGGTCSG